MGPNGLSTREDNSLDGLNMPTFYLSPSIIVRECKSEYRNLIRFARRFKITNKIKTKTSHLTVLAAICKVSEEHENLKPVAQEVEELERLIAIRTGFITKLTLREKNQSGFKVIDGIFRKTNTYERMIKRYGRETILIPETDPQ